MGLSIQGDYTPTAVITLQNASAASNASDAIFAGCAVYMPKAGTVEAVYWIPTTSQAGSATNYSLITLIKASTDGSGTTVAASYALSATTVGIAALDMGSFTLAATAANYTFAAGEVLALSHASQASGIAVVAGNFQIQWRES